MQTDLGNTAAAADAQSVAPSPALCEAEELVQEMRRLLVYSEKAFDDDSVKQRAQALERWLESYRRGLSAVQKIAKNSDAFLHEMRERLKLAMEELQRLEDEGGATPATADQKQRMEDITRAIRRIDHLTASLGEASFTPSETKELEHA